MSIGSSPLLAVVLLSLLSLLHTVAAVVPAAQRAAVLSVYVATNESGWAPAYDAGVDTCTWLGVTCTGSDVT
jgi:hypothetical protein